jgi:molybdopterin converting factor small subunit
MPVTVEMYGVARLRAGRERIDVEGTTVGEALASLASRCPSLVGTVLEAGRLSPHFRLSVNGRNFTSDPAMPLAAGDCLIVISAAVGG